MLRFCALSVCSAAPVHSAASRVKVDREGQASLGWTERQNSGRGLLPSHGDNFAVLLVLQFQNSSQSFEMSTFSAILSRNYKISNQISFLRSQEK